MEPIHKCTVCDTYTVKNTHQLNQCGLTCRRAFLALSISLLMQYKEAKLRYARPFAVWTEVGKLPSVTKKEHMHEEGVYVKRVCMHEGCVCM